MSNRIARTGATPAEPPHSLVERVRARVAEADAQLQRRDRALRPASRRKRAPAAGKENGPSLETRSLGHVFHQLGDAHRQYRRESGQRVSPALRDAANAFKSAPSLTTLVAVAAFLDEDGLLAW